MSQFSPPTPPVFSPLPPKTKKPLYKRKWFIALAALMLIGWLAPKEDTSKSSSNSKSSGGSTSTSSTIPEVPWSQNLKPDAVSSELATASCKELGKVIKSQSNLIATRIAATEKPSSDPYDSSAYLQTINWEDTRHANSIFQLEKELVGSLLATASVSTPTDSQYKGFVADSVNACELTTIATDLDNAAYKLDSRLTSMKSSANNLPWYPKGFSEYSNSGVAFKHSTKKGLGCYSCYGIVYEVISKTSCPNQLYVEANFMDSSGAVEAWTNDTVHALQSGKIAYITLISYSVSGGGGTVQITKVDCF